MLVREVDNTIVTSGEFKTSDFRIKASAKAFRILSEQLYSDKVLAIVRELSCNAYDAHVAAGTLNTPFEVHLPNNFEPWFSIRDNGIGLSSEDIMTIYTTYFESTKTESNDMVGCLGLGSKTPFAYTDNFSVTSYHGGYKREYNACIGNGGVPSIFLLTEEPSSEPNGLCVSMNVKREDFLKFIDCAKKVYPHFKLQPKISGAACKIEVPKKILEGTNWYRAENSYNWSSGNSYAVMGNVVYPIDLNKFSHNEISQRDRNLLSCGMYIIFNIGELEITPSREHLSYDSYTKKGIISKLDGIALEVEKQFKDKVSGTKNDWEKACLYSDISSLPEYQGFNKFINLSNILGNNYKLSFSFDGTDKSIEVASFSPRGYNNKVTTNYSCSIYPSSKTIIYINDLGKGAHARCKELALAKKEPVYLVTLNDGVLPPGTSMSLFIKKLGAQGTVFPLCSTLPKPAPNPKSQSAKTIKVYEVDSSGNLVDAKVDLSQAGMYLEIYQNTIQIPKGSKLSGRYTLRSIGAFVNEIKTLTGITDPVYVFRSEVMKRLSIPKYKNVKWKNFFELAETEVAKKISTSCLGNVVSNKDVYNRIERNFGVLRPFFTKHNKGDVCVLLNNLNSIKDELANNKNAKLTEFAGMFGMSPKAATIKLEDDVKKVLKSYPLLSILEEIYDRQKYAKSLADYVISLDSK
jgi:hypothetical protein